MPLYTPNTVPSQYPVITLVNADGSAYDPSTAIPLGIYGQALVATTVKAGNYAAAPKDFVLVDATAANRTVTLPTAPADLTRVGVKMVATASSRTTTINCGGADHFNLPTGPTSATLTLVNQAVVLQYAASTATWTVQAGDLPLSGLDARFMSVSAGLSSSGDRRSIPATQGVTIISGYSGNAVSTGSDACTILGGGWSGQENDIGTNGGVTNVMQLSTIVGGYDNHINSTTPANPAVICGGSHNYVSGDANHCFIAGSDNRITALGNGTIGGGTGNRMSSHGGVISGGFNNTVSGASSSYAVIAGGIGNTASALNATVLGGFTNTASNTAATVVGGGENTAAGTYSIAMGYQANAQYSRKLAHAGGKFATAGDAQNGWSPLSQLTTDATVSYMRLDGTAGNTLPFTVPVDGAMMLSILVVARRLTSESGYPSEAKGWDLRNLVTRNATTIAVGTLGSTAYGTPTWTADMFVSSNGSVFVRVTGEAAKTIRWVASVRSAEVIA